MKILQETASAYRGGWWILPNDLHLVMCFVIVGHALANYPHGIEFLEHDPFAALCADALGEVVAVVALCQRGFRRFGKFTFFCHVESSFFVVDVDRRDGRLAIAS